MLFDRFAKCAADGYPPCNIEEREDGAITVTLAVAGFLPCDLSVTADGRSLLIKGERRDDSNGRVFLHKGIANRRFQRSFTLLDPFDVIGAALQHGLLTISLQRQKADSQAKRIPITLA